jgi:hypothetical protein
MVQPRFEFVTELCVQSLLAANHSPEPWVTDDWPYYHARLRLHWISRSGKIAKGCSPGSREVTPKAWLAAPSLTGYVSIKEAVSLT